MPHTRQSVTDDVALRLVVPGDDGLMLRATLHYEPCDPLAVNATFRSAGESISWVLGRDLLAEGLSCATGDGDVRVWPSAQSASERPLVMIDLHSPDGQATLAVDALDLSTFLLRTFEVVPQGAESGHLDIDTVVSRLLAA